MWCRQCQQDVPAVVSSKGDQRLCCPRCAEEIVHDQETPVVFDPDWSVDDDLLEADLAELSSLERALDPKNATDTTASSTQPEMQYHRVDPGPHFGQHGQMPSSSPLEMSRGHSGGSTLRNVTGWLLILFGTSAVFSGAVLTGWAFWVNHPVVWKVGLPLAIAGQALLMMGVVLFLDSAAHSRRQQAEAIWQLQQMQQLQSLQSLQPGPSPSIPSPHQLLAELNRRLQSM